jgi:hypothetical protein
MPMSPRLLRPRASNNNVASDADARAYIEAVRLADGQYMEPGVQLAVNDFVAGCKADGIWAVIKACCILMGARTLSGALVPLVGSAPTNTNFVGGDYDRKTGLKGNASNKRLAVNRNNNADPQDDCHGYVRVTEAPATLVRSPFGAVNFSANRHIYVNATADHRFFANGPVAGISTNVGLVGGLGIARNNSANFDYFLYTALANVSNTSSANPSNGLAVFSSTTAGAVHSDCRISLYSFGEFLSLSTLNTRVSTLSTAIGAAIL